jgi:small subunit ribosomal protein S6
MYLCTRKLKKSNKKFMNNYETVFILTPVLSDAQMKEAVEKIKETLTSAKAEIVNEEHWGLRKLAYPISKKTTGFYELIEFNATPNVVDILETQFRRDERVIRFLTFRQDKFAAEYAAKRRSLKSSGASREVTKKEVKVKEIVVPKEELIIDEED